MSEEDNTESIVNEIKDLYVFLTEEEPTPDDEIEAKEIFIKKLKELKGSDEFKHHISAIDNILKKLDEWDTLDHWFIETSLPQDLKELLKIKKSKIESEELQKTIKEKMISETGKAEKEKKVKEKPKAIASDVNISEIISQVTAEFKGKITDLEKKINTLHQQLEKKDEKITELKKDESTEKIKKKKKSRLPPLKIELPQIKKPPISDSEDKKPKKESKEKTPELEKEPKIEKEQLTQKIEENIQEKEKEITSEKLKESEKEKEIKEEAEVKKSESIIEDKKEKKLEKPFVKSLSIKASEPSKEEKSTTKTPSPTQKEKKSPSQPKIDIIPEEMEEKESIKPPTEQKPSISIISEESINSEKDFEDKESFAKVKIKEVEAKDKKASASELYNVFSSITQKNSAQKKHTKSKSKSKSVEKSSNSEPKKELIEENINDFELEESFEEETFQPSIEELPRDKDLLYQELIALEGKRYSLEKTVNKLESRYEKGTIDESAFRNQVEKLQITLRKITNRIGELRSVIKSI